MKRISNILIQIYQNHFICKQFEHFSKGRDRQIGLKKTTNAVYMELMISIKKADGLKVKRYNKI